MRKGSSTLQREPCQVHVTSSSPNMCMGGATHLSEYGGVRGPWAFGGEGGVRCRPQPVSASERISFAHAGAHRIATRLYPNCTSCPTAAPPPTDVKAPAIGTRTKTTSPNTYEIAMNAVAISANTCTGLHAPSLQLLRIDLAGPELTRFGSILTKSGQVWATSSQPLADTCKTVATAPNACQCLPKFVNICQHADFGRPMGGQDANWASPRAIPESR